MILRIITAVLITISTALLGNDEADKIISKVKSNFEKVKDYEVNIKIKVDVDFLKMPQTEAKLFYKQPDKVRIKSDKFAMIPREGLDFSPSSLLKDNYTAILEKKTKLDGKDAAVLKIIPLGDHGEVILTTIWVDLHKYIIRKVETSTKTAGTFYIKFDYDESKTDYPLPSSMVFSINTDQFKRQEMNKGMEERDEQALKKSSGTGNVYIYYNDYKVNKGIPDSVFEEEKKNH
jgi:outer membrane lipoprotein-sorting protein